MNRVCVFLVAGAFALTAGATDWVLPASVTTSGSDALTNLKWWGGTDGARPTADDHLIVGGNKRIRVTGAACPAGSFQLGTDDTDGSPQYGELVHDGATAASFKTLKLHCGHWWCNQQKDYSLTAERIEVTSGAAYPFAMSYGQSQYRGKTMTVSGAVYGDENACLRLGYGKYASSRYTVCASNETFVFDGFATYSGTVSVLAQNPCCSRPAPSPSLPGRVRRRGRRRYAVSAHSRTLTDYCSDASRRRSTNFGTNLRHSLFSGSFSRSSRQSRFRCSKQCGFAAAIGHLGKTGSNAPGPDYIRRQSALDSFQVLMVDRRQQNVVMGVKR